MSNFINEFMQNLGPQVSDEMEKNLGINKDSALQILPMIAPMIMGGLKKQMQEKGGADRVDHILNKYGSSEVLNNLHEVMSQKATEENPDPNLGGLLGTAGNDAVSMISKNFNIDGDIAKKVIPMLSPILLGALSQKRDNDGLGVSGIASLIDQDGDGSILDDVAGMLFASLSGTNQKRKGGLAGLVSSFLKS